MPALMLDNVCLSVSTESLHIYIRAVMNICVNTCEFTFTSVFKVVFGGVNPWGAEISELADVKVSS